MTNYSQRLHRVIPGGAHTYSRGDDQFPAIAPPILARGKGSQVFDPDGRAYLDYGMALRAVTLGYADSEINAAAWAQMENGVNLTRASMIELEAAELLVDLIPAVEMVKFCKNGSNATSAAVKIARAYTGREYVCVPRQHPFFSFDDWFIGATALQRGIPEVFRSRTLLFDYNDPTSLEKLFAEHPDQIAAVMLEPATTVFPCPICAPPHSATPTCAEHGHRHFLHAVANIARRGGALFILDEMITGFRVHLQGAQTYFGVEPDLCTFGKGMANGYSVAAVAGKRAFMEVGGILQAGEERTFLLSTTHGAEMPGLGAFVATVKAYRERHTIEHLWHYGQRLFDGFNALSREAGLQAHLYMDGNAILMNYITRDLDGNISLPLRTLFAQEMLRHGVMMPWVAISHAHGDAELEQTLEALRRTMATYRQALETGTDNLLIGSPIKPVFRKFN